MTAMVRHGQVCLMYSCITNTRSAEYWPRNSPADALAERRLLPASQSHQATSLNSGL